MQEIKKVKFLVVGSAKSATTWLYTCLREHPDIFVPLLKEVNFFSSNYSKGYQWYESFFEAVADEKAVGEVSPSYMVDATVPQRIYQYNPDMCLLFLLRNPLDRAYSHYCMELRYGTVSEDIDKELSPNSKIANYGLYYRQIASFLEFFPRERMSIIIHDDIRSDPDKVLREIFSFLNVETSFRTEEMFKSRYVKMPRQKLPRVYNQLSSIYRFINNSSKLGNKVISYLKDKGLNDKFHNANASIDKYPSFSQSNKEVLADFYHEEVQLLSQYLERDLSSWLTIDN